MNQFLKKIFFISLPVLAISLLTYYQSHDKIDAYYGRFTSPKQKSLIVGSSRAAQGLVPHLLDSL